MSTGKKIHILAPFDNPNGGTQLEAIDTYKLLKNHADLKLWTDLEIDKFFTSRYKINSINFSRLRFPKTGTLLIIGNYQKIGEWYNYTFFDRVIVEYSVIMKHFTEFYFKKLKYMAHRKKELFIPLIHFNKKPQVDIVYNSEYLRSVTELPGVIFPSLIEMDKFKFNYQENKNDKFTIGKISRDVQEKHHPSDPELYTELIKNEINVSLMGATVIKHKLPAGVNVLKAGAMDAALFFDQLDCYFHRVSEKFTETFGRVIFEAMARGVPVVAERKGGYIEHITNGENGFLFDDSNEAISYIKLLKKDTELRRKIAFNARKTVEDMYGDKDAKKRLEFFL